MYTFTIGRYRIAMKSNWPWYARTGFLLCTPFRDAFTSHSRSNNSHLRRKTEFMNGNAVHLRVGCGARHRPRSKSSRKRKSSITMTSSLPWSWSLPRSGSEIRDKNFFQMIPKEWSRTKERARRFSSNNRFSKGFKIWKVRIRDNIFHGNVESTISLFSYKIWVFSNSKNFFAPLIRRYPFTGDLTISRIYLLFTVVFNFICSHNIYLHRVVSNFCRWIIFYGLTSYYNRFIK